MRLLLSGLREEVYAGLQETSGVVVSGRPAPGQVCPVCSRAMRVQKTVARHGATLRHGSFLVQDTVLVCSKRCRRPDGSLVVSRQPVVVDELVPNGVFGYDVMAFCGRERYLRFRQRDEIAAALLKEYGITISTGEVSNLCRRFLTYLEALHWAKSADFRAALAKHGGWILHVDSTCEDGRGTLLVICAGHQQWVLLADKISTERADAILPRLNAVAERFGLPRAAMRDLGRAVTKALRDFAAGHRGRVTVFGCHAHFLADVGGDLLRKDHDELRKGFHGYGLRARLRKLARELGRMLGTEVAEGRRDLSAWQVAPGTGLQLPQGRAGLAVIRGLIQWALDYRADAASPRRGFPYDQPYLDFFHRCRHLTRAVRAFLGTPPADCRVARYLARLSEMLRPVSEDEEMANAAERLRERVRLFNGLRAALRLRKAPPPGVDRPRGAILDPAQVRQELRDVKASLTRYIHKLKRERSQGGHAAERREGIDIVLAHYRRHGRSLSGHDLKLPGGGVLVAYRTNNISEGIFHEAKMGERRRSGRKRLTYDLEQLPAAAILASNLKYPDYVKILCGSLAELPAAFSALDRKARERGDVLPTGRRLVAVTQSEPETASLPTADRRVVRAAVMTARILAAAASRGQTPQRQAK